MIAFSLHSAEKSEAAAWQDAADGSNQSVISHQPVVTPPPAQENKSEQKNDQPAKVSKPVLRPVVPRNEGLRLHGEELLSTVSYGEVPWRRRWYPYAVNDEVMGPGEMRYMANNSDTLIDLARIFGVGFNELRDANPDVNVWVPEPGSVIKVPYRRVIPRSAARIIVNLPEMRVYHKRRDGWLDTYPIGIGQEGLLTPQGSAHVTRKAAYPSWYVPESILKKKPHLPKVIPSGPDNPLGTHAVYLSIPSYLIHGTQKPYGVGRRVSHGCMRLYPEDIVRFYEEVVVNDSVEIVNQPIKAGWHGEELYLQVHDVLSYKERPTVKSMASKIVSQALQRRSFSEHEVVIDWKRMQETIEQAKGVPQVIGRVWHPPELEHLGSGWAWEHRIRLPHHKKAKVMAPVTPAASSSSPQQLEILPESAPPMRQ
ncbi:MAG: L,D-transpeptidase family protein [Magnetococcales bacterium]|nr:L,D-transpeptidase family protein [Magnetococcales bacterium]